MVSGPGATRRSTSLVSTASPRATEPNTRTSRKPRRDAAARICLRAARRDPRSGDRSCCGGPGTTSPFPVSHATRVLALFTEPEVGPFRDTSYQASRPAATRVAHSRIRLARQASSPSSPSRWHARPARQLLYVTGRPSWLADDQGQQLGAQASSGVVTLAGYPRPPLTSSLVRRHPAHDRAQQVPPGQRPLAALGQDGAALAHLQRGLLPGPSGREVVIPGPVGRRQQVPACGPLSGKPVGVAGSGWGGRTEVTGRRGGAGERRLRGWVAWGHRVTG